MFKVSWRWHNLRCAFQIRFQIGGSVRETGSFDSGQRPEDMQSAAVCCLLLSAVQLSLWDWYTLIVHYLVKKSSPAQKSSVFEIWKIWRDFDERGTRIVMSNWQKRDMIGVTRMKLHRAHHRITPPNARPKKNFCLQASLKQAPWALTGHFWKKDRQASILRAKSVRLSS